MRAYSSMPLPQFVAQLRAAAIASKASSLVIDLLDQLDRQPSIDELETERGAMQDKMDDLQRTCDDLREELQNLLDFITAFPFTDEQDDDPALERATKAATDALSRSVQQESKC